MNTKHCKPLGKVGRVTPCAPLETGPAGCGAHGVTRPTLLRNLVVIELVTSIAAVLLAALPVKALGGLQKAEAIAATLEASEPGDEQPKVLIETIQKNSGKKE